MMDIAGQLFGNTRAAILAAMLLRPEESLHVRELARVTGVSPGTLHRELKSLTELGLLSRRVNGRQVNFSANRAHPIHAELSGILRKTSGLAVVRGPALMPLWASTDAAFVYGSMAAGSEQPQSDVDVMVLGRASFRAVVAAMHDAEKLIGREINPTVMATEEFRRKRDARDQFVSTIWRAPKLWIVGGADELG